MNKEHIPRATRGLLTLLLVASISGCLLPSCTGGGNPGLTGEIPQPELHVAVESGIRAEDLRVEITRSGSSWELELHSEANEPAESLLLEIRFGDNWVPEDTVQLAEQGRLNLLLADRPGFIALGMIMPEGSSVSRGPLLRSRLVDAGSFQRSAAAVPQGASGQVQDLRLEDGGGEGDSLAWTYKSNADYDQNSEVNIADLVPLGVRLNQPTDDGELDELDGILDGDGNGLVTLADLTPMGVNYRNLVSGYRIYATDSEEPDTGIATPVGEVPFDQSIHEPQTRRRYSIPLPEGLLDAGAYCFIRPFEVKSDEEGASSNLVQLILPEPTTYRRPPADDWLVDDGQCQDPSLLLLNPWLGYSDEDAPVIVYTRIAAEPSVSPLYMAYYGETGWTQQDIGEGGNYLVPRSMLSNEGPESIPQAVVFAYDIGALALVARFYDPDWQLVEEQQIPGGSGVPTMLAVDRDSDGGFALAHAWQDGAGGSVLYSSADNDGNWSTETVYTGDTVGGLDFRFDPAGADPWLAFTSGTVDTSETLLIDFSMQVGRLSGGIWQLSPFSHPDSPLAVDIGFRADNTPQLAFSAARDYTVEIPLQDPFTLSLLVDVNTAEYNGAAWDVQRAYESELGIGFDFINGILTLSLDLAPGVSWSTADELMLSGLSGEVDVDAATQEPQDGSLASWVQYMARNAGHSYSDSSYYSGSSGRAYSWGSSNFNSPSCAYLRTAGLQVSDLLGGNFSAAGELSYWQP